MITSDLYWQAKYYYDLYNCRYFAPFILLFLYSILGAWIFYVVENENEKEMKLFPWIKQIDLKLTCMMFVEGKEVTNSRRESLDLNRLRTHAFQRIVGLFQAKRRSERMSKSRDLLIWYEVELQKVKLPEALEWDMWGALFYVGTIFTTIGYGNIFPRTVTGRAISVVYAIVEHSIARVWLSHREKIKKAHQQTRNRFRSKERNRASIIDLEEGKFDPRTKSDFLEDQLIDESSKKQRVTFQAFTDLIHRIYYSVVVPRFQCFGVEHLPLLMSRYYNSLNMDDTQKDE
ncbi:hypothetical protein DICVIV_13884 [Dictyocaulus viviparus]|uniref:Potassium channel domain-containing protein n=1 Tax=Dictyocaulus viviparus TaxID=29172 RepID=A0A0D8X9A2_DICVI|nr:hypothetical protein DICVIV_13884 [Dictyocaulus viviparus]